jgi:hypothetical protein
MPLILSKCEMLLTLSAYETLATWWFEMLLTL